ncbi:TRL-like family protein [Flavobacterium sp.]|uniref:TRL-like family protein n=1 Tax=Flavobacterium sp. TaxID=239 RepID=UPI00286D7C75|nr:TRL-like family protein [Flavobacterium sp.]
MKKLVLALAASAMLTSCSVTLPVNATSNAVGKKVGSSSTMSIFGLFFDGGDASILTAAKQGGISKISTVDFKSTNYLFIIGQYETIVSGE